MATTSTTTPPLGTAGTGAADYAAQLQRRHQSLLRPESGLVQRAEASEGNGAQTLRDSLLEAGGEGTAPDSTLQAKLKPHLGFDAGMARLHHNPAAIQAARDLNAEAFTIGRDVFFNAGRLQPSSPQGLRLVAHEMTHVAQQMNVGKPGGKAGGVGLQAQLFRSGSPEQAPEDNANPVLNAALFHRDAAPRRPSLVFAMPQGQMPIETEPPSSLMATQSVGMTNTTRRPPSARRTDANAVADRVHELMRNDARQARHRGAAPWRGVRSY